MEKKFNKIEADDKTVEDVLSQKYIIDFFQREYSWGKKQIEELISDLETKFNSDYDKEHEIKEVKNYSRYYLGPIVLSYKDGKLSVIDGQQRLTSLTLLLIYLNNLQKSLEMKQVPIDKLIFSDDYGEKSFNLDVEERNGCMKALYENLDYDSTDKGDSVKNIVERYQDIEEIFPSELKKEALAHFIYWLKDNVILVKIITYSDDDAYTIFESMNDRGLNLTPTEMLKGYLLSNIGTDEEKYNLNEIWKKNISKLKYLDEKQKDLDLDFFKTWFRAKYAESIRPGKKGAINEDFEKIGTRFHSWLKENKNKVELKTKKDFYDFINEDFVFYVKLYIKIFNAECNLKKGLESIYYISHTNFTLHYNLLFASIKTDDTEEIINKKLQLVAHYIESFIMLRSINSRTLSYSAIRYTIFTLVKDIRDKNLDELRDILKANYDNILKTEDFSGIKTLGLNHQNRRFIHLLLSRITNYIELQTGTPSHFEYYINDATGHKPFEIEHIWGDKFEEHRDEFEQKDEFDKHRNLLGDLILLPNGFNQSYGALPFEEKLPHYFGQNLLVKSLNEKCYERHPAFLNYIKEYNLNFKSYNKFKKKDIEERQELYQKICELIWSKEVFNNIN